jgi:hypothetical protein
MRAMAAIILCLSASVLLLCGSGVYADPVADSEVSFSMPFDCDMEEPYCLADSFKSGLNVVLVGKKGICKARSGQTFTYELPAGDLKATRVLGTAECPVPKDEAPLKEYRVAVVGADPAAVRVAEPKTDGSPLPKEIESKARKIARSEYQRNFRDSEGSVADVADSPPDVFSVGNTAFLLFKCSDEFYNQDGLPVLVLNNNAFLLKGSCAIRSPCFFSVNEKLYVAYSATVACCGCGDVNFFVYDLSGESPKLVYHNGDFST